MAHHRSIIDALAHASENNESVVLATVVRITGSSYGGVGARMVIKLDGSTIGIVSGGCLESDLAEHAKQVHATHCARLVTYDTRADDDAAWGLGLGCNGLIDVLLEALDPGEARAMAVLLEQAIDAGAPRLLATVIAVPPEIRSPGIGAHALINGEAMESIGDWGEGNLLSLLKSDSEAAFAERRRGLVKEYEGITVAFEVVMPSIRLLICGSGPDVVPLARMGNELGWNVIVVDHRRVEDAHPERFPESIVVECAEARHLGDAVALTRDTAAVVMSHHFARDLDYMRALLASDVAYVGMLGPRARTERMLAEVNASGELVTAGERLFSPVGLDIGGDGPDAIALAIIAEVSAVMNRRRGGSLRDRTGPLHESQTPASTAH